MNKMSSSISLDSKGKNYLEMLVESKNKLEKIGAQTLEDSLELLITGSITAAWWTIQVGHGYIPSLEETCLVAGIANAPAELASGYLMRLILGVDKPLDTYLKKFTPSEKQGYLRPILQFAREFLLEPAIIAFGIPLMANYGWPFIKNMYNYLQSMTSQPNLIDLGTSPKEDYNIIQNSQNMSVPLKTALNAFGAYQLRIFKNVIVGAMVTEVIFPILESIGYVGEKLFGGLKKGTHHVNDAQY